MTREEAKEILENWNLCHYTPSREAAEAVISALDPLEIISALRPDSREQVEKVWRGAWTPGDSICPICEKNKFDGLDADIWADWMPSFCPNCGAPMTDEAVQMVMERLEALKDGKGD